MNSLLCFCKTERLPLSTYLDAGFDLNCRRLGKFITFWDMKYVRYVCRIPSQDARTERKRCVSIQTYVWCASTSLPDSSLFLLREGGRASAVCSVDLLHTFDISIHLLDCSRSSGIQENQSSKLREKSGPVFAPLLYHKAAACNASDHFAGKHLSAEIKPGRKLAHANFRWEAERFLN